METGNINRTILMQGITKIGTRRAMKSHTLALHKLTTQRNSEYGVLH
jgi:hypothetical protein